MEDIINMITLRLGSLEKIIEGIEERKSIVKTSQNESTKAYDQGHCDALEGEVGFLYSLLEKVEDEIEDRMLAAKAA